MDRNEAQAILSNYQAASNVSAFYGNARFNALLSNLFNTIGFESGPNVQAALDYAASLSSEFPIVSGQIRLAADAATGLPGVVKTETAANGDVITTYSDGSQQATRPGGFMEDTEPWHAVPPAATAQPQAFSPVLLIGLGIAAWFLLKD